MLDIKFYDWLFESFRKAIRKPIFGITVLTVSICAMVAFGIIGIGRGGEAFADVRYWYLSAKAWLAGLNPYDHDVFQTLSNNDGLGEIDVFAYPPQSFSLGVLTAAFPYAVAQAVWITVNVIAVAILSFWGVKLLRVRETAKGVRSSELGRWLIPAIIIGNPFTAHVLWTGQTTLIIAAALITGWQLVYTGNFLLAGILLGFATIKPQISLLIVVWLLLEGFWPVLLTAGATVLALSAVPLSVVGSSKILPDWLNSMKAYQLEPSKTLSLSHNTNLKSLFEGLGLNLPSSSLLFFILAGIAITIVLWRLSRRSQLNETDVLGILLGLSLLLFFGRDYDIVCLVPILSAMWWHVRNYPSAQLASFGLMTALFIPHRLLEKLEVSPLLYWRIVILTIFVLWLLYYSFKERNEVRRHNSISSTA